MSPKKTSPGRSRAIGAAGLREADEGGRVIFWRADARMFRLLEPGEVPVVSAPRLIRTSPRSRRAGEPPTT